MLEEIKLTQLYVAPTIHWTEAFGAWLHVNDRRPNTVSGYLQDARHFAMFFERENGQAFEPGLLNATDVKKYFARQDADKSVKPTSRNRRLATLKVMVAWCVEEGVLEYDPTVCIKRQPTEFTPRDRSADEMARLNEVVNSGSHLRCASAGHAWLGARDRAIWLLFRDAGLRIDDVRMADVADVDFTEVKLHLMGKGGKKASIDITPDFLDAIRVWLDLRPAGACQALITDQHGQRISTGQIRRRVQMIGESAGVRDLKPHDLRHTYAHGLADAFTAMGLPQEAAMNGVRKQLRHADRKTTAAYFGIRDSQIRAALEVM